MKNKQDSLVQDDELNEYRIDNSNIDWEKALKVRINRRMISEQKNSSGLISVASHKKREKNEVKLDDPAPKKKAKHGKHKKHQRNSFI